MKFFTSYYANMKNIPKDYITVSISGDIPDYLKETVDIHDRRMAPNWDLFKEYKNSPEGLTRELQYTKRFKTEVLIKNDITTIIKDWGDQHGPNQKYVLLCFETPNEFCHRQIVAEAIEEKYGIQVPELDIDYKNYERRDYKFQLKSDFSDDEW